MSSKYQEALDKLISMIVLEKHINSEHNKKFYEAQPLLQELVEKEKPMKPIWKGTDSQGATFYYSYCPKCSTQVSKYTNKYCTKCGQKIDWSEK